MDSSTAHAAPLFPLLSSVVIQPTRFDLLGVVPLVPVRRSLLVDHSLLDPVESLCTFCGFAYSTRFHPAGTASQALLYNNILPIGFLSGSALWTVSHQVELDRTTPHHCLASTW